MCWPSSRSAPTTTPARSTSCTTRLSWSRIITRSTTCWAYLYSLRREYDRAIKHLEDSLAREDGFAPAIAALGLALRRKGDSLTADAERAQRNEYWSQAEMRLLNALRLDPHLTDAEGESYYGSLGGLYRRQGRYADAIDAYRRAEQITPASSYPLINLASLYWHQGEAEKARAYFERVHDAARLKLDTNPLDNWARADFAQALAALGHATRRCARSSLCARTTRRKDCC